MPRLIVTKVIEHNGVVYAPKESYVRGNDLVIYPETNWQGTTNLMQVTPTGPALKKVDKSGRIQVTEEEAKALVNAGSAMFPGTVIKPAARPSLQQLHATKNR